MANQAITTVVTKQQHEKQGNLGQHGVQHFCSTQDCLRTWLSKGTHIWGQGWHCPGMEVNVSTYVYVCV